MRAYGMCVAETPGGGAGVEFFVADDRGRVLRGARYGRGAASARVLRV